MKLQNATGAQAKALGRKIKGLDVKVWDENSASIMKGIIKDSFEQNPKALEKLLATGNATLTHTQDKTKWGKLFPKILMEVRQELGGSQPAQLAEPEMMEEVTIGTPAQQAEAQEKIDSLEDQINSALSDANSEDLRVKINEEIQMFEPENWTDVESWLKHLTFLYTE